MNKIRKNFEFDEDMEKILEETKKEQDFKTDIKALKYIMTQYDSSIKKKSKIEISETSFDALVKSQKKADMNIQIIIEILNSILMSKPTSYKMYLTDVIKSDIISGAEQELKNRITKNQNHRKTNRYKR